MYVSDTCINLRQYTWEVSTFWRYLLDGGLNQTNLKCGLRSRISFLRNPWGVKGFERLSLKELSTSRLKSTIIPWENIPVLEEGPYFIVKIIYGNNALFKAVNKEKKASQDRWTWRILTTVCPYSLVWTELYQHYIISLYYIDYIRELVRHENWYATIWIISSAFFWKMVTDWWWIDDKFVDLG